MVVFMGKIILGNSYYTNMNSEAAFVVDTDLQEPNRLFGAGGDLLSYSFADERYLTLNFNEEIVACDCVRIIQKTDRYSYENIEFLGSNDGTNWTSLLVEKNISGWNSDGKIFYLPTTVEFLQYKVIFSKGTSGQRYVWGFEIYKREKETLQIDFRKEENVPSSFTGEYADGIRHIMFTDNGGLKVSDLRGAVRDILRPGTDITSISDEALSASTTYSSQKIESMLNSVKTGEYLTDIEGIEDSPVGTIIEVIGKNAPSHYLPCNNQILNKDRYNYLYNYFLTQFESANIFGGDGVSTFGLPSLNDSMEEEIKYYTHDMSSESDEDLTLTCSSRIGDLFNIVNEDDTTVSTSSSDSTPWFSFCFTKMINLNYYSIKVGDDAFPTDWILQGRKGTTWVDLDTRTEQSFSSNEKKAFSFNNSNYYSEYRIIFSNISSNGFITIKKIELCKVFVGSSNKMKCIKYEPTFYMNMSPSEIKAPMIEDSNSEIVNGLTLPLSYPIEDAKFLIFKIKTTDDSPLVFYVRNELFDHIILDSTECGNPYTLQAKIKNEVVIEFQYWFKDSQTLYIGDVTTKEGMSFILERVDGIKDSFSSESKDTGTKIDVLFAGHLTANSSTYYPYADNKKISDYSLLVLNAAVYVNGAGYGNTVGSIIHVPSLLENESPYCSVSGLIDSNQYNVGLILNEDNFCVSSSYTSLPAWNKQVLRSIIGIK